ncbi:sodium:calcium antiporter [Henriciella mobilis]|uniref:calcium/sodium antiporter n=1 Tax=Henriciella mobilis TaxID=2305467 RepID=UPI000E6743AB|nr:calcium/sodium antiporter [Henriciella mobilis]RIJ14409.1 sodium:calcium antiporter [Henriciella mobilis]RIJ19763.1 sodium:calcium antiporter [Henriciella mobilis]
MLVISLLAGLALLLIGGDLFVRGAVSVARKLGVSPLLIGLTLVGFGTSTPELVTSLQAAMAGSPGVATGNVVGSNIANILLILGLAAMLKPVLVDSGALKRDGAVLAISALVCLAVVMSGVLDRLSGLVFIAGLVAYLGFAIWQERRAPAGSAPGVDTEIAPAEPHGVLALVLTVGGLALTILGASLLIDGAVGLATRFGISETIIGLSIVAIGTSLPELVTSVVAALRGQNDVAFGNIVGSNIYNVFGILGVTALVQPIPIPREIMAVDIWVMLAATGALIVLARTGHRITRGEGALMLAGYAGYTAWLASQV